MIIKPVALVLPGDNFFILDKIKNLLRKVTSSVTEPGGSPDTIFIDVEGVEMHI